DNTLARAISRQGVDIQLIPTYTPIRTDEEDQSVDQVFFGGINVYLQQKIFLFRYLPPLLDRFLDMPWLIRKVTSGTSTIDSGKLGALAVSMLKGQRGNQRKEVRRLCRWLSRHQQPEMVMMTNLLIGGCIPSIKKELDVPVVVTLQGDDIFLDELRSPYRQQAIDLMRGLVTHVDGFLVNSEFYAERMGELLEIPREKIHLVPLGIDTTDFQSLAGSSPAEGRPLTVGYLARLAPEKGLHLLVDAFLELHQMPGMDQVHLRIAGWLGEHRRDYVQEQFNKLQSAGLEDQYQYDGAVDRQGKLDFLGSIDLLSVPTVYEEPKGLFVLESLAAGVPVVQPRHGAFPELLSRTGGGVLVDPGDTGGLATSMAGLLLDPAGRKALGDAGQKRVHEIFNAERMGAETLEVLARIAASR
ncbi:MAG: glycosyltransferase family 4 protein, partial [Pirellulaceae bacterium]|nr:glycosyltransferase family 4 protein [Pirellulaceae bacterium]